MGATQLRPWQRGGPICEHCDHVHLGADVCHNSENREHLCGCKGTKETGKVNLCEREESSMSENVEVVEGNAPAPRRKKGPALPAKPAKDQHLPGLEPKVDKTIHRAIEEYVEARDQRMQLTRIEVEKKNHLLMVMKTAGVVDYDVAGHQAHIAVEETIKAKLAGAGDEGEAETE